LITEIRDEHQRVRLGGLGTVVSSPSGVRGGAPATIDIFAYLQVKRGLILYIHYTMCQCVQRKKI